MTSVGTSWSGFSLEESRFESNASTFRFELSEPHLAYVTHGTDDPARWRAKGADYAHAWMTGRVYLLDAGCELSSVKMPRCRQLVVQLHPELAATLTGGNGTTLLKLPEQTVTEDPVVGLLVQAMHTEIKDNCPSGRLFGESLSMSLLARLQSRYSRRDCTTDRIKSQTERRLARVLDYIRDNLDRNLSLTQLADLAGMTPQHFCIAFKATFDRSPYQCVLHERVAAARKKLNARELTIAQIAFAVGFSSQSHFTATFRRIMGITPAEYRRGL